MGQHIEADTNKNVLKRICSQGVNKKNADMNKSVFKSILHNIGVVAVGFIFAFIGVGMDKLFGLSAFHSNYVVALGSVLIAIGFLLRVWAAYLFYEHNMRVIRLFTQAHLITDGPYRFTRHPLYLGGNVFIMLGAALVLGTPGGVTDPAYGRRHRQYLALWDGIYGLDRSAPWCHYRHFGG